tara:strand:+ start:728 stop:5623 length:4896 start_codon:yes stop_codon:yes gene_type:complete
MDANILEVFDPSDVSLYQFEPVGNEIIRDGLLSSLEGQLLKPTKFLLVEGLEGSGKSTLLYQFVQKNKRECIALFIDSQDLNQFSEENLLKDLLIQVSCLLHEPIQYDQIEFTDSLLNSRFQTLQYELNRSGERIFVVIDGMEALVESNSTLIERLLGALPVTSRKISYLFSDEQERILSFLPASKAKQITVPDLSSSEASEMLPDLGKNDINALLEVFRRTPSQISAIRRMLDQGVTLETIFSEYSEDNEGLLDAEWNSNISTVSEYDELFCLLAFSDSKLKISDLVELTSYPESELRRTTEAASILSVTEESIKYTTLALKKYAKKNYENRKNETILKLIHFYLNRPESEFSITSIANYQKEIGDHQAVVKHLSNENLCQILDKTSSLGTLVRQLHTGISSAKSISSAADLLRFSHVNSLMDGIASAVVLDSQLEAHLERDEVKAAQDLASSSFSAEEKLQLLCKVAKHVKDKGRELSEALVEQIVGLEESIDPEYLGVQKVLNIALELFPIFPDRALSLINNVDKFGYSGENKSDFAFLQLGVAAMLRGGKELENIDADDESLSDKKRSVLGTLKLFKRGTPAKKIIEKIEEIDAPGSKLFFIKNWLEGFPNAEDNLVLIDYALKLAISTTDYTANADFYRVLTNALLESNSGREDSAFQTILSQENEAKKLGPTNDYVSFQLSLHDYEIRRNIITSRLDDLYSYIEESTDDLTVQLSSFCIFHKYVLANNLIANYETVEQKKEAIFSRIIDTTADQYEILKPALEVESTINTQHALNWALRLNTQNRRDMAVRLVIKGLSKSTEVPSISRLCGVVRRMQHENSRTIAYIDLLKFVGEKDELNGADFSKLRKVKNTVVDFGSKCLALTHLSKLSVLFSCCSEEQVVNLENELRVTWTSFEDCWEKIDTGFKIHNTLLAYDPTIAKEYLEHASELRLQGHNEHPNIIAAISDTVDLCVRALAPMIKMGVAEPSDISDVVQAALQIPSSVQRAKVISRIISLFQKNDRYGQADSIIESNLLPLLEGVTRYPCIYNEAFHWAAPVLYLYSVEVFEAFLEKVGVDSFRESIISFCITYLYRSCILADPFRPVEQYKYNLSYGDICKILTLIAYQKDESAILHHLRMVAENVTRLYRASKLTGSQNSDIQSKVRRLVQSLLGETGSIGHCGYKLCGEGVLLHIANIREIDPWRELVDMTKNIGNTSDVAFVILTIVDIMPIQLKSARRSFLKLAADTIEKIPSNLDKIERYKYLSEVGKSIDREFVKKCLREAIYISALGESEDYERKRMAIIDIAHALDKDFPAALAAVADDDKAKKRAIESAVKERLEQETLRNQFKSDSLPEKKSLVVPELPELAWEALGQFNADNGTQDNRASFLQYIESIGYYETKDVYPLISYYICVTADNARNEENTRRTIRPIFSSLLSTVYLLIDAFKIEAGNRATVSRRARVHSKNLLVGPGDESKAVEYLREWIGTNDLEAFQIIDPYFEPANLELIGAAISNDPNFSITVLSSMSRKKEIEREGGSTIEEIIESYWNTHVNSSAMPRIELIFVGLTSLNGGMPIHDRWWLSERSGLRLGTSINGIGKGRLTELSALGADEMMEIGQKVEGFLSKKQMKFDGEKLRYSAVVI